MCTSVVWSKEDNGQATLVARNMDWFTRMGSRMWVIPRGIEHTGSSDSNPMKWKGQYGSVVISTGDDAVPDGMNEKGLVGHLLWLSDSTFGERDMSKPGLSVALWLQYYFDNFATVQEVIDDYNARPYQLLTATVDGVDYRLHAQISDATGDVAVLEVENGEMQITHGKQYPVLTNQPTFAEQEANLKNYLGFGGTKELPGTVEPEARFVRASYYRDNLATQPDLDTAIAALQSVIRNCAQPYSEPHDKAEPSVSPTIWTTLADSTNLVYAFEPTYAAMIVWLDLKELDFTEGLPTKQVPLPAVKDKIGNVAEDLEVEPMIKYLIPATPAQ